METYLAELKARDSGLRDALGLCTAVRASLALSRIQGESMPPNVLSWSR